MEDLKNKDLSKVMWLPEEDHILLDIRNEKFISINSKLYYHLSSYINIDNWRDLYKKKYSDWLNNDDHSIYNIHDEVNSIIINALLSLNKDLKSRMVFYWFDVDRTDNEKFIWEYCPLSKRRLIQLGDKYPKINSFISPDYPLIFPSN